MTAAAATVAKGKGSGLLNLLPEKVLASRRDSGKDESAQAAPVALPAISRRCRRGGAVVVDAAHRVAVPSFAERLCARSWRGRLGWGCG